MLQLENQKGFYEGTVPLTGLEKIKLPTRPINYELRPLTNTYSVKVMSQVVLRGHISMRVCIHLSFLNCTRQKQRVHYVFVFLRSFFFYTFMN